MKEDHFKFWVHRRQREFVLWLILALIVSLLIHFFILKKINGLEVASFNPASFDAVVPRRFHLERVDIDPKLLEEPKENKKNDLLKPVEVIIPEKLDFSDQQTIKHSETSKPGILNPKEFSEEKPEALLDSKLIPEVEQRPQQALIEWDKTATENNTSLGHLVTNQATTLGNYSQLDQLLEQKTALSSQTAPILLPTDLLFEYDADRLKSEAEKSLEKLALLIQRNPKAQFVIEGFTDSFGSDAYNLDLSTRRAESIKNYLVTNQFINREQIQTRGFGKTHFLVSSNGTIDQQKLNRRVEIVIKK